MLGKEVPKVKLHVDNKSAVKLGRNPVHHERSKHIDLRYHYIRECVEQGKVDIEHVHTDWQLADVLTKSLGRAKFTELRHKLGISQFKFVQQD